jgi:IS5 family transposase
MESMAPEPLVPGDPDAQLALFRAVTLKPMDLLLAPYYPVNRRRPPYPPSALLKALVYQKLRRLPSWRSLARELAANPTVCMELGFVRPPAHQTFSVFTRRLGSAGLSVVMRQLIVQLRPVLPRFGEEIAVDSSMVKAYANPFNRLGSDVDATWGVKKVVKGRPMAKYGYKLHVAVDANHDLPLVEIVTGANKNDSPILPDLLRMACSQANVRVVMADAGYDSKKNYFAALKQKVVPIIALNPRRTRRKRRRLDDVMPVDRDSEEWTDLYSKRASVERVFSRLKDLFGLETHLRMRSRSRVEVHFQLCIITLLVLALASATVGIPVLSVEAWRAK